MPVFDTPEPISVTVELGVGDLRVVAGDRADTVVEVRPSDPAKKGDVTAAGQTRVEYAGGRLLIKAPKNWRRYTPHGGGESVDAVRSHASASLRASSSDVSSTGSRGVLSSTSRSASGYSISFSKSCTSTPRLEYFVTADTLPHKEGP